MMTLLAALVFVAAACSKAPSGTSAHVSSIPPHPPHRGSTHQPSPPTTMPETPTTAPRVPTIAGGSVPVAVPSGPSVSPPATITSDCSSDVSHALRDWINSLPPDQTIVMQPGACYLVNEGIKLKDPQGLTVYGGSYRTTAVSQGQDPNSKGRAVFTVIGGSHVTLEEMQIRGANPGGYHPSLAFAGGIEFEGTANGTVRSVTISNTFGDGITLSPLRGGADHNSGTILAPSSAITIEDVTVSGVGRQGLTFASVAGAQVSDVIVDDPGINTFDVEADQWDEGAIDVTIDGCLASGGAFFFANGGAGDAAGTHDITVENCSMLEPQGGSAILVERRGRGHRGAPKKLRGPITFLSDQLQCGASVYTACVELRGSDVTVTGSRLDFPASTIHEPVYGLAEGSRAVFTNDVVLGYGAAGRVSRDSSVRVTGGLWTPSGQTANRR